MMHIIEHDAVTQKTIGREATSAEKDVAAAALAEMQKQSEAWSAVQAARASALGKLAALGLTDDEIAALVGA
jgi:acyl-CoA reductase-like NAD-dependent aldehyde dehydrogenase